MNRAGTHTRTDLDPAAGVPSDPLATRYDLIANITHEGQAGPGKGAYKIHLLNKVQDERRGSEGRGARLRRLWRAGPAQPCARPDPEGRGSEGCCGLWRAGPA